ncbi:endonuclease V [Candidatus Woesearchaeota archaeon]|nr:endonuclease V [Candidatus Woesearchaeota archaeon]
MIKPDFGNLKHSQIEVASKVVVDDEFKEEGIKYIAGFETIFFGKECICAAAVLDYKTLEVKERKFLVAKAPMNYVPGFAAFREGPIICQLYYDLEYDPDVIIINGHGIAHPMNCGPATFVGVELAKPTIGIAKSLIECEEKDGFIIMNGEKVGKAVKTKEHANALYVSTGNIIPMDVAAKIILKMVIPPHKLPEPLHVAHRFAKKAAEERRNPQLKEEIVEEL